MQFSNIFSFQVRFFYDIFLEEESLLYPSTIYMDLEPPLQSSFLDMSAMVLGLLPSFCSGIHREKEAERYSCECTTAPTVMKSAPGTWSRLAL